MSEYYCVICLQRKADRYFKKWFADKTKSRRCDGCLDSGAVKERVEISKKERELKPALTEIGRKAENKRKCERRDRIAEHQERKQRKADGEYFEL